MEGRTSDECALKMLAIVDEYTRECPAIDDRHTTGQWIYPNGWLSCSCDGGRLSSSCAGSTPDAATKLFIFNSITLISGIQNLALRLTSGGITMAVIINTAMIIILAL